VLHPSNWGLSDSVQVRAAALAIGAFFLLWFVNMAITGFIARRQGRDDGLWAVLAFFVGPIALLTLLVAPRGWLRGTAPDPTLATPESAPEWTPHASEWVRLSYGRPATIGQRMLGALLGGGFAGGSAGLLLLVGGHQVDSVALIVWSMAGAVVGYVLAGELIGAERAKFVGVGVAAAVLVIVVAELIVGVLNAIQDLSGGALAIFSIMLVVVTSMLYPILYALFDQGLLAAALAGGLMWATLTDRLLRLGSERGEPAASGG
jgi:hypothetical protein